MKNNTGVAHPRVIWLIGLPNAGKTTVALKLQQLMRNLGCLAIVLDGNAVRDLFNWGNSRFDLESRKENGRRIGRLAAMISSQGMHVVVAANTLFHDVQRLHRENLMGYFEVYLYTDERTRRARDHKKQLYSRYDRGEISQVLGLDLPADEPKNPDLILDCRLGGLSAERCAAQILDAVGVGGNNQ